MAFIVETGAIVVGANSYSSLTDANLYFTDRGSPTAWTDSTDITKRASLIYATAWLDQNITWNSSIQTTEQSLGWPRAAFYDKEGRTIGGVGIIPSQVKIAAYELALEWIQQPFNESSSEGVSSESIGSTSISYIVTGSSKKSYSFVRMSLRGYGKSNSSVIELYRA